MKKLYAIICIVSAMLFSMPVMSSVLDVGYDSTGAYTVAAQYDKVKTIAIPDLTYKAQVADTGNRYRYIKNLKHITPVGKIIRQLAYTRNLHAKERLSCTPYAGVTAANAAS